MDTSSLSAPEEFTTSWALCTVSSTQYILIFCAIDAACSSLCAHIDSDASPISVSAVVPVTENDRRYIEASKLKFWMVFPPATARRSVNCSMTSTIHPAHATAEKRNTA